MSKFPNLNLLNGALINDCFNFLKNNSDDYTKNSINQLLKGMENTPDLIQEAYVLNLL